MPPAYCGVRSQLVVNAGVAHRVFGEPLHLVDGLGGIGVPDELGVQIARVIGRLQGKTEVVHGEHVFEEFRFLKIADAAGLPRGIQFVGQRIGADVEVVIVFRLVDAHAPQDDGRMVPVAANHAAHVVDRYQLPRLVADVLPAGNFLQHQQSDFVAGIEKVARLRIVRGAHDIALELVAQNVRVAALGAAGHRLADKGKGLMTVQPAQLDHFAVEFEAVVGELRLAETDGA